MNKVILMGRLCADPELKTNEAGVKYCHFAIGVDKQTKEKGADFFEIVAFNKTAEFVAQYFGKGKPIIIEGNLTTNIWTDKNGNKRKDYRVNADKVEFVPRSNDETQSTKSDDDFTTVENEDLPF